MSSERGQDDFRADSVSGIQNPTADTCMMPRNRKSRTLDQRGGGYARADRQQLDPRKTRIWKLAEVFFAQVGAIGVNPNHQATEAERVRTHAVVLAVGDQLDQLAGAGKGRHGAERG